MSGIILLAVAWTNESSQTQFRLYPEFKSGDVTFKVNAEKRSLEVESGKGPDNRTFSHTWTFTPSLSRWIFRWIFGVAMPALHDSKTLSRVEVAAFDEDDFVCVLTLLGGTGYINIDCF